MAAALTLADVFSAEAAEAPYQRLVTVLNRHEAALERLHSRLDALQAAHEAAGRSSHELQARAITPLADRVLALETAAEREREALRRESHARIEGLASALQLKCDRKELQEAAERAERATAKLGHEIRSEAASFELVNSLQADQSLLHERLATVDRRLDGKLDKTEASRMDAALTQLRAFQPVSARLTARLDALEAGHACVAASAQASATRLQADAAELARLGDRVLGNRRASEALEREVRGELAPQLRGSVDVLERLDGAVSACEALGSSLETALRSLSAKFHAFASSTADSARQVSIGIKATQEDVAELRCQASQKWDDTARAIDRTATSDALDELRGRVERLADRSDALERHAALSSRFLDWFASRGEAHEHNLRVVETQLGRVAHRSDPRRREPFSGSVRFPRPS